MMLFSLYHVLGWHGVCCASGLRMNTVQPASYKQQRRLIKHDSTINTLASNNIEITIIQRDIKLWWC